MTTNFDKISIHKCFIFHNLVNEGTSAVAARKLKLPAFKIHNDINSLEKFIGEPLILRNQSRVILTEAGQNFAEFCRIVVESMPLIQQETQEPHDLKIATTHGLAENELPDILTKFQEEYPKIKIAVLAGPEYLDFTNPSIDVIIGEFLVNRADLTQTQLMVTRIVFVATQSYLNRHGIPKTHEDLRGHNLLVPLGYKLEPRVFFDTIEPFFQSNMLKSVCKMALLGKGVMAIPKNRLQSDETLFRNLIIVNENLQSSEVKTFFIRKRISSKAAMLNRLCEITKNFIGRNNLV
ncbi:MAG: LysR family transcriptional regulator [Candidatus Paracaedibacteraceae bacterium]|nr:LysR family transcriptional regulator [Candidatus Paracaedibacteraceae bacterium]